MSAVHASGDGLLPWRPMRVVLLSAWQARRNQGSLWPWALIGVLMVMAIGLVVWFEPGEQAWALGLVLAGAVGATALLGVWMLLAYNVLAQNHPQLAPTVPGHVRALRFVLILGVAVLAGLAAAVTALMGGPVAGLSCTVAGVCTVFVCGIRWPRLWIGVAIVGWTATLWVPSDGAKWLGAGLRSLPWPVLVGAVALAVAWALRAVVMQGGERHANHHNRQLRLAATMKGTPPMVGEQAFGAGGWGWTLAWGQRVYARWLMRLVGQRHRRAVDLLALGQGPQLHWTGVVTGAMGGWAFAAMLLMSIVLFPQWDGGQGFAGGLAIGLAFASYTVVMQTPALMWARRREQVLLRLLPGAPQGPALNRWLALHLSRLHLLAMALQWFTVWGLSRLVMPAQRWVWPQHMAEAMLVLGPLAMLFMWRDWSRLKAPGGGAQVLMAVGAVALAGLGFVWFAWFGYGIGTLAGLVLALGLPLGAWRWRALQRAPAAWPAGRR
ncbi:MAG: hypothetical protein IPJ08_10410 [Burkholderiales bacterium]|nr:hypothetical protein [Burkholderiales bacterium]